MAFEQQDFLDRYSYSERFFLSHPFLWKIEFLYEGSELIPNINKAITKAYKQDADNWKATTEPDAFTENGNILVARTVNVPNENSQFDIAGQQNMGGFLPGYALNKRVDFLSKNLAINFFDTIDDIEHFFFRPWMIALGIDGLLERNLLCPKVILRQYDNRMRLRKGYEFREVFPTNVEGYQLSYNDEEFQEKSVTFAFRDYKPLRTTGQALPFAF
jgi:hypothetical protein|tara:strand:+ start:182 stop:829 length:648 start_codon:yes stop_codon:yes gene_type:complete